MQLKALYDKRGAALKAMRDISGKALAESRELTAEENQSWDKAYSDQEAVFKTIQKEENLRTLEREAAERKFIDEPTAALNPIETKKTGDIMAGFRSYLQHGQIAGGFSREVYAALQVSPDSAGGYLVPPMTWINQLIQKVDDMVFLRQFGNVMKITQSESLGAPSLDADPDDADWTTELATGNEDSAMTFGMRELKPSPVAKRARVSNKLMKASALPIENIVMERLAYKFAITQEKGFMTGSGASKPLGVFTASANGISTARDISTDNTTTAITMNGLKNAKYSMKGNYWGSLRWIFHRDTVKMIAKLVDGNTRYLWQDSVVQGEPDRLLGFPVHMSEYAPNTFTTGLYVGILGDFSKYWIVDSLDLTVQRLVELYAETNQVGFIGRMESDAMPVLEEAFARVTLA